MAVIEAARAAQRARMNPAQAGTVMAPTNLPANLAAVQSPVPDGKTRMRFTGDRKGPVTYYVKGRPYTGANTDDWRFVDALKEDVDALERMGVWARVRVQPAPPPPPVSAPVQPTVLVEIPAPPPAPKPEPATVPVPTVEQPAESLKPVPTHIVPVAPPNGVPGPVKEPDVIQAQVPSSVPVPAKQAERTAPPPLAPKAQPTTKRAPAPVPAGKPVAKIGRGRRK